MYRHPYIFTVYLILNTLFHNHLTGVVYIWRHAGLCQLRTHALGVPSTIFAVVAFMSYHVLKRPILLYRYHQVENQELLL